MHIKHKQTGVASVEAVFLFPIILLLFLIMLHITKAMMTNIDVTNEARLTAWRGTIGVLEKPRIFEPVAKSGNTISSQQTHSNPQGSKSLIDNMRTAGDKYISDSKSLTNVLDGQQLGILVTTSTAEYKTSASRLNWSFDVIKKFAMVGTPIWTAEDVPIGYDQYLKDSLNSKCLFTKMFPNANGTKKTDCKAWL